MSTDIHDKYSEAVAYLTEHPEEISDTWFHASTHRHGCLFAFCTPSGERVARQDGKHCGCLTMIRGKWWGDGNAWTDDLTAAILADERIPAADDDIGVDDLEVFAEWQRKLDVILNRT